MSFQLIDPHFLLQESVPKIRGNDGYSMGPHEGGIVWYLQTYSVARADRHTTSRAKIRSRHVFGFLRVRFGVDEDPERKKDGAD